MASGFQGPKDNIELATMIVLFPYIMTLTAIQLAKNVASKMIEKVLY
ncbi:MAG: hypothetical protein WCE94_15695 [Candidatus Methanoperedens sp.]